MQAQSDQLISKYSVNQMYWNNQREMNCSVLGCYEYPKKMKAPNDKCGGAVLTSDSAPASPLVLFNIYPLSVGLLEATGP